MVIRPLETAMTVKLGRPRFEGANIRTWVGFKHFVYLVEEAVLECFRARGHAPGTLYHHHGLGLEFVESSVQLPTTLDVDDVVTATVTPGRGPSGPAIPLTVRLTAERAGAQVPVLTGRVRVALVRERDAPGRLPAPAVLAPFVVDGVAQATVGGHADRLPAPGLVEHGGRLVPADPGGFLWSWRVPYFYCHYSERLQHSGYVRAMEEVVDRFLDARGISVRTMLGGPGWIPVVSRARLRLIDDVRLEETVHTLFTVEEVLRRTLYRARMDCFVERGGRPVRTATGSILHGYAMSRGDRAGQLAEFDDRVVDILVGGAA